MSQQKHHDKITKCEWEELNNFFITIQPRKVKAAEADLVRLNQGDDLTYTLLEVSFNDFSYPAIQNYG